jgi:hypothetical protein
MRKGLILLVALSVSVLSARAQNWGGGIDDNDLHFGFTFQYLSSEYKVLKNADWQSAFTNTQTPSAKLNAIYSKSNPGYGIGFVVNRRLAEHADLRFTPSIVFSDRLLYYEFTTAVFTEEPVKLREQKIQSTMVEFPLSYKLKSDRRNNFRAYVLGGAKYSMDISSNKKTDNTGLEPLQMFLKNQKNILSYEAGIGFDLYFEYFKMSPEIKLSNSFNNVLKKENQPYAQAIDKLMLRHVTFSLFFE